MPNYDNIEIVAEITPEQKVDNQIFVGNNSDFGNNINNKKNDNDLNSVYSNSVSNYSKNMISVSSINEFNNSSDSDSLTDSSDSESNERNVKRVQSNEVLSAKDLEQAIVENNLPNAGEELISNININNLSLNQSAGITIGNTNNIKYIVNQYYPKSNGNENFGFVNDENDMNKNAKPSSSKLIKNNKYILALNSKFAVWIAAIIALTLIIALSIVMIIDFSQSKYKKIENEIEEPGGKFFTRAEWGALPAKQEVGKTNLPMTMVVICHTGDVNEKTEEFCKKLVQSTQRYHLESQNPVFADIGYSFLVCGDGNVYEGRGWNKQNGIVDNNRRDETLAIGITGNYELFQPSKVIVNATKEFIRYAVEQKKIIPRYKLYAHNTFNTILKSPGHFLRDEIAKWRYFTNEV